MVHQYLLWAREALASEAAAIGEVSAGLGAGFGFGAVGDAEAGGLQHRDVVGTVADGGNLMPL